MADTAVEFDLAFFHGVEDVLLAYQAGAGFCGGFGVLGVGRADDGDAQVSFDGVGEAHAVADCRAVFDGAQGGCVVRICCFWGCGRLLLL